MEQTTEPWSNNRALTTRARTRPGDKDFHEISPPETQTHHAGLCASETGDSSCVAATLAPVVLSVCTGGGGGGGNGVWRPRCCRTTGEPSISYWGAVPSSAAGPRSTDTDPAQSRLFFTYKASVEHASGAMNTVVSGPRFIGSKIKTMAVAAGAYEPGSRRSSTRPLSQVFYSVGSFSRRG